MDQNTLSAVVALAAVLSAGAAMISAGIAAWAAYTQHKASRPQVRVEISIKTLVQATRVSDPALTIDVMNKGALPVNLVAAGFTLRNRKNVQLPAARGLDGRELPTRLEPGEAISIPHDIREIARTHVSLSRVDHAYARTAAGDTYKSEPEPLDWLDQWASA